MGNGEQGTVAVYFATVLALVFGLTAGLKAKGGPLASLVWAVAGVFLGLLLGLSSHLWMGDAMRAMQDLSRWGR